MRCQSFNLGLFCLEVYTGFMLSLFCLLACAPFLGYLGLVRGCLRLLLAFLRFLLLGGLLALSGWNPGRLPGNLGQESVEDRLHNSKHLLIYFIFDGRFPQFRPVCPLLDVRHPQRYLVHLRVGLVELDHSAHRIFFCNLETCRHRQRLYHERVLRL